MPSDIVSIFEVPDYDAQLGRAAEKLGAGGVVVIPTETVYGAAASLQQPQAMARLRKLRAGPENKPFTVHIPDRDEAAKYIGEVSDIGRRLMQKLWPGPVGLMFQVPEARRAEVIGRLGVGERDIYDNGIITLRCPDHIVATDFLARISRAVVLSAVQTSARERFDAGLREKVDLILDAGPTRFSKPSTLLRVKTEGYDIVRSGVYDERIIERLLRTTILFVCSGNTCRSPMAEALARRALSSHLKVSEDELEGKGIIVMSAGSFAMPGAPATPQAVEALKSMGADLSKHRSRPLSVELIHQADMIFTMSRNHASAVAALVPSASEKTLTLDPAGDIEDPIGGDVGLYQELARQLQTLVEKQLHDRVLNTVR